MTTSLNISNSSYNTKPNNNNVTENSISIQRIDNNKSVTVNSNKRKHEEVDPLDYLHGDGDGKSRDKMADSTANGSLWQQRYIRINIYVYTRGYVNIFIIYIYRPYPAPGKAVKSTPMPGPVHSGTNIVGPRMRG